MSKPISPSILTEGRRNIPFSPPDITDIEINEVVDTLKSGWITTGPKTKLLEKKIAEFTNTSMAVCLNSATAAMELTLRVLGVGPGDEVITSAYTYTASASVIDHVGAKIILVDTAENSFQMDYEQLEKAITPNTKVIIPVDLAGVMCDYDKIFEIVERRRSNFHPNNELQEAFGRVVVLADAAHSFGATYKGKQSGEVADFTSFSFHAVKNFTTGEGGAVTWRDIPGIENEYIYKQYMLLSLHGQSKDALAKTKLGAWEYDIVSPAYKCNMTDIVASIGLGQMERYPLILERRRQIIEKYNSGLIDCEVDVLKHYGDNFSSSGHLYLVRLLDKDEEYRNKVIEKMAELGIATNVHYKPLPMHTAYKKLGFDIKDYPNAFDMYRNEITLPLHTMLSDEDVEYVIKSLDRVLKEVVSDDSHVG
ncbi:DegT/DnrJ/EryC1/StrS family aminotransferase [Neobacillus massiliamazoniensis]|uniref:UDP-bacillosamine synthetase n=1 Tax=Neobacillus massiliamazoniensis TaxID=1499688 RepID=A0A0U1NQZ4_9BACI|nr:DegT/DnrJ/EryC1/StrS family aminotransferase [Neobacillus massiliamazoniensis]CRK80168.1 UDP-bacillosamine synthetase [Neobacillus massiliamazoniensis]